MSDSADTQDFKHVEDIRNTPSIRLARVEGSTRKERQTAITSPTIIVPCTREIGWISPWRIEARFTTSRVADTKHPRNSHVGMHRIKPRGHPLALIRIYFPETRCPRDNRHINHPLRTPWQSRLAAALIRPTVCQLNGGNVRAPNGAILTATECPRLADDAVGEMENRIFVSPCASKIRDFWAWSNSGRKSGCAFSTIS